MGAVVVVVVVVGVAAPSSLLSSPLHSPSPLFSSSSSSLLRHGLKCSSFAPSFSSSDITSSAHTNPRTSSLQCSVISRRRKPEAHYLLFSSSFTNHICRTAEYQFPDPIPEFADAETEKFRTHLLNRLPKKEDIYGDSIEEIVEICTEIFSTFLHSEYGGPGTLLVLPFIDMADTINERGLPGGPQAARLAVTWAQKHVDKDWNEWTGSKSNQ